MAEQQNIDNENIAPETTENVQQSDKDEKSQKDIEMEQEAQLRAKYPGMKGPGTSALLQKRLSQKTKYFDSGDYAMAKAKGGAPGACKQPAPTGAAAAAAAPEIPISTGEAIPTPDNVPHRKTSNRLSKLVSMS